MTEEGSHRDSVATSLVFRAKQFGREQARRHLLPFPLHQRTGLPCRPLPWPAMTCI